MEVFHDKGYLIAESEDKQTKNWLDGRVMIDWGDISSDSNLPGGTAAT